jgi:HSP20 family protein
MPTIIRKSVSNLMSTRREVLHAVSWQVRSNIWSPPVDEYETDQAYVVRLEIAGMREEDFDISFENNSLIISGSRSDLQERRAYHQMEIRFGKFATAIGIPISVNIDKANAEYRNGFLTVILPKAEQG